MKDNFGKCFAEMETYEGYHQFSDNPHDPGGSTESGVTQRTYDAYRSSMNLYPRSVKLMSDAECEDIYLKQYWLPAHGPDLPAGLDLCQFDEAVNSGVVEATKLLQQALGVTADGMFGLETLDAVHRCSDVPGLIRKVCGLRLGFWRSLKTWVFFGRGWTARYQGIQEKALAMYAASGNVPPK